jgi:rare lipoprotein A
MLFFVLITMLFLSACGHPKAAHVDVPPPPAPEAEPGPIPAEPAASIPKSTERSSSKTTAAADLAEPKVPANAKPLDSEIGLASWYGPPYHNRRASNGEVYNITLSAP